ncbi:hypothetical protein CGL27_10135 [Streptomyces sp. 11-1-2]|nr:hypothetical protein CGL27_10135 [Streptomyces sp. 11-1-2]
MTTYEELTAWAGAGNVTRADPAVVSGWRIPEEQKALLVDVGVPIVDQLIEYVPFQVEAAPILQTSADEWLYRLTQNHHDDLVPGLQWSFGVQPGTGTVYYVLPEGEAWFANSSIDLWLRTLHHYGLHVSESEILSDPDDREDEALAELGVLADELKKIDPPAFDGYIGFIWAEFLDRWPWSLLTAATLPESITHRLRGVQRPRIRDTSTCELTSPGAGARVQKWPPQARRRGAACAAGRRLAAGCRGHRKKYDRGCRFLWRQWGRRSVSWWRGPGQRTDKDSHARNTRRPPPAPSPP